MNVASEKASLRQRVWLLLEEGGLTVYPRPVYGRIPNFVGSEAAARKVAELEEWEGADVVKVNPDAAQREVRRLALLQGKTLVVPSPRLRTGFLAVHPVKGVEGKASTIAGAFRSGRHTAVCNLPLVDMFVAGSVAVSLDGRRLGKGGGFSDIEYGILRETGRIDDTTPVVTTVHETQIMQRLPTEIHDVLVDYIVTPERTLRTVLADPKPTGIAWNSVSANMLRVIPPLRELRMLKNDKGEATFKLNLQAE